jgi:hypothetical protein
VLELVDIENPFPDPLVDIFVTGTLERIVNLNAAVTGGGCELSVHLQNPAAITSTKLTN